MLHPHWEPRSEEDSEWEEQSSSSTSEGSADSSLWSDMDDADELPDILEDDFYYPKMSASERIQMRTMSFFSCK